MSLWTLHQTVPLPPQRGRSISPRPWREHSAATTNTSISTPLPLHRVQVTVPLPLHFGHLLARTIPSAWWIVDGKIAMADSATGH
jgi:hypothetical protein